MVRLPDIPLEMWKADQQDLYDRQTNAFLEAEEYDWKTAEIAVPPDAGSQAQLEAEARRIEDETYRLEQERIAEQQRQEQEAARQYELQQQERQRQEEMAASAQMMSQELGIPTPDDVMSEFSAMGGRPRGYTGDNESSALLGTASTPPITDPESVTSLDGFDQYTQNMYAQDFGPTYPDDARDSEYWEAKAGRAVGDVYNTATSTVSSWFDAPRKTIGEVGQQVGEAVQSYQDWKQANQDEGRPDPLRLWGDLGTPEAVAEQERIENDPTLGDEEKTAKIRALFEQQNPAAAGLPDPARDKFLQESSEAAASAGHAAPRLIGELIEIAAGDPEQKRDISAGLASRLGLAENITPGAVIANMWNGPRNVFLAAQATDLGASLLESPEITTGVLGTLQGISYGLQKNPKLTLAAVGGIIAAAGGAADALINQRDFTGVEGTDILDLSLEALAGGAAGVGMIVGGKPTAKLAHAAMKSLIKQSGIEEAAVKFDRFLGRLYDEALIKSAPRPEEAPALAQALFDDAPGMRGVVNAARGETQPPSRVTDKYFTVSEANEMLDELEYIGTLEAGTPEFMDALRRYTTKHKPWDVGDEDLVDDAAEFVRYESKNIEHSLTQSETANQANVVFDPATGKVIRFFDTRYDAERYVDDAAMEGKFYDFDMPKPYDHDKVPDWLPPPAPTKTVTNDLDLRRKYASESVQEVVEKQADVRPLDNKFSMHGMGAGGATGAVSGAVQGFAEDENAPLEQRIEKAGARAVMGLVTGAAVGNVVAPTAALGAAKAIGKLIESGRMSVDILDTHPDINYRTAALALLMARNKADDALISLDRIYVRHFVDTELQPPSALLQRVQELKDNGATTITAGEIRELADASSYEAHTLGRTAREILLRYLTDKPLLVKSRLQEMGADEASALDKLRTPNLWRQRPFNAVQLIEETDLEKGTRELTANGPVEKENAIYQYIESIAAEAGVPPPRVFLRPGTELNAAAYRDTGNRPILVLEQGFVKAANTLGEDGFKGILMHELSHATDDDLGKGLLLRASDYVKSMLGKANTLDAEAITAGPERRMQQLLSDPRPALSPTSQANALTGAGMGGLAGAEEEEPSLAGIAGGALVGSIFGKKVKSTRGLAVAARSPIRNMFVNPSNPPKLTNKGFFERVGTQISLKFTDSYKQFQQMQDDVAREWKKQTGKLLPAELLAAELKRFDSGSMAKIAVDDRMKPVLNRLQELGFANEDVDAYLMAQQAVDIVESGPMDPKTRTYAWINRQFPGGMTYREAQRYLINFESDIKQNRGTPVWAQYQDTLQQIWDFGDELLELKRDAGFITDAVYKELRAKYPRYVPFNVLKHITDDTHVPIGRSLSIQGTGLHELTASGTKSEIMSPLASVIGDAYETYAAVQKNRVFNSFVGMWEAARDLGNMYGARGGAMTRDEVRVRDYGSLIEPVLPSSNKKDTHVQVTGFIDGDKKSFWVSKELGDLTRYDTPVHIPMLAGLMDAFKMGATSRNPVFLAANTLLDLHGYMVREVARESGTDGFAAVHAINPITHAKVLGVWARTFGEYLLNPKAWEDMMKNEYRGDMKRFLSQGGGNTGYFNKSGKIGESVLDQATAMIRGDRARSPLEKEVQQLQRGMIPINSLSDWLAMIKDIALMKPVERIGERIEMVPRVAAMRLSEKRSGKVIKGLADEYRSAQQAIQAGGQRPPGMRSLREIREDGLDAMARSTVEGVQAGRTTTIDFAKGGTWAKNLNQVVPFFNVAVQSVADVKRAFDQNPAGYSAAVVTGVVAPVYFAEVWNNSTESRRKDYEDVPQYIKDQGLVIMYPNEDDGFNVPVDDDGNRHPQFMHIRFRQLAPFGVLTREVLQNTLFRKEQMQDYWSKAPGTLFEVVSGFSPIQGTSSEDVAMSFIPPVVSTALQAAGNRDTFRDRDIVSKYSDERATPLSVGMANTLGQATAGTGKAMGFSNEQVDQFKHPSYWEFLTRDVGTGYASMWHGASEIIYGKRGVENNNQPQDQPVTGGMLSRFQKGTIGEGANKAREKLLSDEMLATLEQHKILWRPSPSEPELLGGRLTRVEYAKYQTAMNKAVEEGVRIAANTPEFKDPKTSVARKEYLINFYVDQKRMGVRNTFAPDNNLVEPLQKRYQKRLDKGEIVPRSR